MIFSSQTTNIIALVIAVALYALILGLDVFIPWLKDKLSTIANYICIALHIAFILSLVFVGVYIEIPVIAFMISLFAYSLSSFFAYKREERQNENAIMPTTSEGEEENSTSDTVTNNSCEGESVFSQQEDNREVTR